MRYPLAFALLTLLKCGNLKVAAVEPESIELSVGQWSSITSQEDVLLEISQKGIVLAQSTSPTTWRIVGLKPGFVVVSDQLNTWQVTVKKKESSLNDIQFFPSWVCKEPGLYCNHLRKMIFGECDNPWTFSRAKAWCQSNPPCLSTMSLSPKGQILLKKTLEAQLPGEYSVKVPRSGSMEVGVPCQPSETSPSTASRDLVHFHVNSIASKGMTLIRCHEAKKENFKVEAKVVLTNISDLLALDFDSNSNLSVNIVNGATNPSLLWKQLTSVSKSKQAMVLGTPSLYVQEGIKGLLKSGEEIPILRKTKGYGEEITDWKNLGTRLEVLVTTRSDSLFVDLDFSLTLPLSRSSSSQLSANTMKTRVKMNLGQESIVGEMQVCYTQKSSSANEFTKKIPFIGPLFTGKESKKSRANVKLLMKVNRS